MRKLLAAFALVAAVVAAGLFGIAALRSPERMPDVWSMTEVGRRLLGMCAPDKTAGMVVFDATGDGVPDYFAFFVLEEIEAGNKRPRPFAVLVEVGPGDDDDYIVVDSDRDGIVDTKGRQGDPGIGEGPCDALNGDSVSRPAPAAPRS